MWTLNRNRTIHVLLFASRSRSDSSNRSSARCSMVRALRMALAFLLCVAPLTRLTAQGGALTGRVTNADGGKPLVGALVQVLLPNGAVIGSSSTRADGRYRIGDVTPGTYRVRIAAVGFTPKEFPATAIRGGAEQSLDRSEEHTSELQS